MNLKKNTKVSEENKLSIGVKENHQSKIKHKTNSIRINIFMELVSKQIRKRTSMRGFEYSDIESFQSNRFQFLFSWHSCCDDPSPPLVYIVLFGLCLPDFSSRFLKRVC